MVRRDRLEAFLVSARAEWPLSIEAKENRNEEPISVSLTIRRHAATCGLFYAKHWSGYGGAHFYRPMDYF
jgi:hypothetical protein